MPSRANPIHEASLLSFAQSLIRTPSVLGREGAVADLVLKEFQDLGYDRTEIDCAGSALGIQEGDRDGPTLLLDAHMDTVDVVPVSVWTRDPFSGELGDGRLHGRGSSDMKGALAAMVHAGAALDRRALRGRLVVSASVAEESIEGAALKLVMERCQPDFVVIGEASGLNLARGGRGRAEFILETQGKPSHASTPHLGVNAVQMMIRNIEKIEQISLPAHALVGRGALCLTDIISEPYPAHSVVPSRCRVTYERRTIPGESLDSVREELETACNKAGASRARVMAAEARLASYTGFPFSQVKWFPPWEIPEDHSFVEAALCGLRRAGLDPRLTSYQFCTNAAYSAGVAGVPTIGFGPSRESLAHIVNEYLETDQLMLAARGYLEIARAVLR